MSLKMALISLVLSLCTTLGMSQTTTLSPKNLSDRYEALSCSLVHITSDQGEGTGFFIGDDGTIVTAAHVVMQTDKTIDGNILKVTVIPQTNLRATTTYKITRPLVVTDTPEDQEMASRDLAIVKGNFTPRCHLEVAKIDDLRIGSRLISIGYPGFDSPAASLYEGFLSSRHPHKAIPVGNRGQGYTYDVYRVQMPITTGASGSPVIDDQDRVVGVISELTAIWTKDLTDYSSLMMNQNVNGGMMLNVSNGKSYDPLKLLGQLAAIVHDFESPGAGLAVPSYYLKLSKTQDQKPSTSAH
jgi:V8-like Glu-specific endopeptidase